ncbi:MAG: hypothetical protein ACYDCQ_10275 [Dehalococcoidia bacterium]
MTDPEQRATAWWHVPLPPWWLWALAAVTDAGTGVWRLITAGSDGGPALFFGSLIWPGLAIAGAVLIVAWLGWSLDLE